MFYVLSHYVILNSPPPPKTRTIQQIQPNPTNENKNVESNVKFKCQKKQFTVRLKKTRSPIESYRASGFGFEKPV